MEHRQVKLVQFSTPVWIPAKSALRLPVPFITTQELNGSTVELDIKLFEGNGEAGSQIVYPPPGMPPSPQPVPVASSDFLTALYWDTGDNQLADMLGRLRASKQRKGGIAEFDRGRLRPFPNSLLQLACFNDLAIGTTEQLTPLQAQAVKQWLVQGGHLWIMADRVKPETAKLLLGDDWTIEPVEETQLANVPMEEDPRRTGGRASIQKLGPFERPIRMTRVVCSGMEISHRIENWPAIMWRNVGRGQLLVTTFDLSAMDWQAEPEWHRELGDRFLTPPGRSAPGAATLAIAPGSSSAALHDMASSVVARGVVGRWWVLGVLGSVSVLLLVGGGIVKAKGRVGLEMLAPAALVLVICATGTILFLGAQYKGDLPLTIASMSEGKLISGAKAAAYTGAVDIYSPSAFEGTIKAPPGSWVLPDLKQQEGHIVRLSWRELDWLRWEHIQFLDSATVRNTTGGAMPLNHSVSVAGTFDKDGLLLELNGSLIADGQELRLCAPNGRFAPEHVKDNIFRAGSQLPPGVTAGPGAITHMRAEFIKAMEPSLAAPREGATLFLWTKALDPAIDVEGAGSGKVSRLAWTLAAVPVEYREVAPGTAVTVPSGLMRVSSTRIRNTSASATGSEMGNELRAKLATPFRTVLRWQLPTVLKSMKVEEVSVRLAIMAAADHQVRLVTMKPGGNVERDLKDLIKPVIGPTAAAPIEAKLGALPELQPDSEGNILLGIEVTGGSPMSFFEVEDFTLTVKGHAR